MPRFSHLDPSSHLDHRLDNQIVKKEDLRFHEQDTAEDFATSQYMLDYIPRSVVRGISGLHMVLESPEPRGPEYVPHPNEVFYIASNLE